MGWKKDEIVRSGENVSGGKCVKETWKLLRLLPKATMIHIRKQLKRRDRGTIAGLCGAGVVLILLLVVIFTRLGRSNTAQKQTASVLSTEEAAEGSVQTVPEEPAAEPTPTPEPVSITLSFAGDCTLGSDQSFGYEGSFTQAYDNQEAEFFLNNVREIFEQDDLTVVNFEGTITESDQRADKSWAFKGPKEYTGILTSASVEAANLANNHSSDYGEQSLQDTRNALTEAGIVNFGFEETAITEVRGVKVGLLGMYTVYEDDVYISQIQERIAKLKDDGAQVIVANFHWGLEMDYTPEADQVELAHAAIDAGAHLVIGHHPHVLQGVEVYKGRYIVYSLGNFCFGGNSNPGDYDCMIFQQTFTVMADGPETDDAVRVIPCSLSAQTNYNNYQPTPAEGEAETRILGKLRELSEGLGERNIFAQEAESGMEGSE